jgi:hypothetical protein
VFLTLLWLDERSGSHSSRDGGDAHNGLRGRCVGRHDERKAEREVDRNDLSEGSDEGE